MIADLDRLSKEYDGDEQFARAIERFGNVVLGNFFLYSEYDLKGVDDKTLDRYANILADFPFPQVRAANPQTGERDLAAPDAGLWRSLSRCCRKARKRISKF